jgi:hypothetical protein
MYSRSDIRHACFRAKNSALSEKNQKIIDIVVPLLGAHQRFDNFATVWDILVDVGGNIVVVNPETDIEFIRSTCLEKQFQVKYGVNTPMDSRKQNIITIVDILMLDGKMTWENFEAVWGVGFDAQIKMIYTKMFVPTTQKTVTEEMIQASKISKDDVAHTGESGVIEITPTEMSESDVKKFTKLLSVTDIK